MLILVCLYQLAAFQLNNILIIHNEMHLQFASECRRERWNVRP